MALDFGIVTYHVTSYLSVCSRNLESSARRRRPYRFITVISWQSVSVSSCTLVASGQSATSTRASLLILPPPGLIMSQNALETVNELIAGSFGGAAQVLVGQPLDTIKTRAQIAPSSVPLRPFLS